MRKNISAIFLMWCLLFTVNLYAKLPKNERVPGGVAVVPLDNNDPSAPKVLFEGERVAVVRKENRWIAVIGIPISQLPGIVNLHIEGSKATTQQQITISDKSYPTEYLKFPTSKVMPTKEPTEADKLAEEKLAKRLEEEKKILNEAYTLWDAKDMPSFTLEWPLKGRISGFYGARRVINGKPRKPHTGLDIAAPQGTPIQSSAKGKVINIGEYYFTGKTVVVDHGLGFKTLYCHLNEIKVKNGDQLEKGQVLGTVGKTGRATGPHLHFGVSLNNQRVSPELFLPKRKS